MTEGKGWLSNALSAVLIVCAVLVTGLVVRRELFTPRPTAGPTVQEVRGWEPSAAAGSLMGPANATVRIVTFSDFQCPFCADANAAIERARARDPRRVAVVFHHFPLEAIHPHARAAAIASECANAQGRFEAYHDALFADQAGIGTVAWTEFARRAAVADTAEFRRCTADGRFKKRVDDDLRAGEALGVKGTPTFILNGQMTSGVPGAEKVDEWVAAALRR